jgi:1,2-diacylglycerol 3-alpha-glucosyltransferase
VLTLSSGLRSHCEKNVYAIGSVSASLVYDNARIGMLSGKRILDAILRWSPDVVHSQCEFTTHVWARRIAKELDVPLVHTYHTIYEDYTHYYSPSRTVGKKVVASFSRRLLDHTDAVIAPTAKVARLLHEYKVASPVSVVPTGLELGRFRPARDEAEETDAARLRAGLGIRPDQRVLLSVCRLAQEKNLDLLVDMVLDADREDTVLVLVGDGPYREHLAAHIERRGASDKVRMVGVVDPKDVPRWYRMGDVFVSASRSETQGLTYIEALASGLPLLCMRDECIEQVVLQGRTGYMVEDSAGFSRALATMLDVPGHLTGLSEQAAVHARATCGADAFARSAIAVYERTIEDYRARRMSATFDTLEELMTA